MITPLIIRRYSPMNKLEINVVLKIRIPDDDITVNGILKNLEEETPIILNKILENILRAIEERAIDRIKKGETGHYVLNGHQRKARKLITHFGVFYCSASDGIGVLGMV